MPSRHSKLPRIHHPRRLDYPELKVHGIEPRRLTDASVMPTIVSANTNAASLALPTRQRASSPAIGSVRI
jgi:choline dehydrogenase-like flavoprotein